MASASRTGRRDIKQKVWICFLLAIGVLISCTKPTPSGVRVQVPPGGRLASSDSIAKTSPHSEEFEKTFLHGTEFFKDKKVCAQCHGIDFSGGSIKKSCLNCHPYPHQERWAFPSNHGSVFTTQKEKCLKCHGAKSAFKDRHPQEFVSCGTCHTIIPHSTEIVEGDHWKLAQTYEGKCTLCHTDLKRNMPNLGDDGCTSCHDSNEIPIMKWHKKP